MDLCDPVDIIKRGYLALFYSQISRQIYSIESGPSLARVDAAVGEDARAQHALREAAGVGLSAVAGGPADDAHGRLGEWEVNRVCPYSAPHALYDIYIDNRILRHFGNGKSQNIVNFTRCIVIG